MSIDQSKAQTLQQLRRAVALQRLQQSAGAQQQILLAPPILPVDRSQVLPLSWTQQRLWFLDQLDHAASAAYHLPTALRLSGALNRAALRASLDRVVARHESLRTCFVSVEGVPQQRIAPADAGFTLIEQDLRGLAPHAQQAALTEQQVSEARARFDLSSGPLIRGRLLCLSETEHVLLVTQHHIISDGWSIGVLMREVSALYRAYAQGQADPLPALPIQYADYAVWQRQWLQGEVLQRQLDFWRQQLSGAPALLELPTDRPRPAVMSYRGARLEVRVPLELTMALRALSQRHGATLFMTLLAGWSVLLSRWSGQDDLVIGSPVANRQRTQIEPLIGFFVNTLALRVDLSADPSVAGLLTQVKATTLGAYAHQELPFEQVVEALQPERSLSYNPVFQVLLSLNNTPGGGELSMPELALSRIESAQQPAQFDLALALTDTPEGLAGGMYYATDLFDRGSVERLLERWVRLLGSMVGDETQAVSRLALLSAGEREQVLEQFNATQAPYAREALIHELFEQQVARTPGAVAVVYEQHTLSYEQLNRRANQLAHYLIARGVGADERVGVCLERSLEMAIALLGILKAGGAYVPLEPSSPAQRLGAMLQDAAPRVLLTQARWCAVLPASEVQVVVLEAESERIEQHSCENPASRARGLHSQHLAYMIYTSGSTGEPKGAMNEHAALINRLQWMQSEYCLGAQDRVLQKTPYSFDVSVWEFFWTWLNGAQLVMARAQGHQDPGYLRELIERCGVTRLHFVPSMLQVFLDQHEAGGCTSVRHILCSGEELSRGLQARCLRSFPQARLSNLYGPTEAAIDVTSWECVAGEAEGRVPIGRPIANLRIYILDRHHEPVPVGVTGEIYIGGVGVGRGYWKRAELTAQRFLRDPFASGAAGRMYRTGDLGRWRVDGAIEYLGRNDFQVKVRGLRIELGEIEAQLSGCAGVREAVVIAREDAPGEKRLVAYVVAEAEIAVAKLREQLLQVLPEYMVPNAFVSLAALPLTPNGKLDRKALPVPDQASVASREYAPPVGEVEQALASIWQELLGVARVGREDHFFELGGHSLLVISLIERMRQRGLSLDVRAVFMTPVLRALAAQLSDSATPPPRMHVVPNPITAATTHLTPALLPLVQLTQVEIDGIVERVAGGVPNIQDIYPLAPLQEGILLLHLLGGEDTYLRRTVLAFDSEQRLLEFVGALQTVIDRHDILRSAVHWEGVSQPVQVVHRRAQLPVTALPAVPGEAVPERFLADTNPRRLRMDLRQPPLLAVYTAHDPQSAQWLMALLSHHMVSDFITMDLIESEIQMLLQGQGAQLPVPVPYRNFIAQIHAVAESEHEAYFREQLGDVEEPTAPFGVLTLQEHSGEQQESRLQFSEDLARSIREAARQQGVTPAVLFHVGWAQVLAECSGRDDVVFGTVLSGRLQGTDAADQMIGMFINSLPLRLPLAQMNVTEAVRQAHVRLSELLSHEQASLTLAQRCSAVPPRLPLLTSLLNYRHNLGSGRRKTSAWEGVQALSRGTTHGNHPMTLSVEDWGEAFGLSILCMPAIDGERLIRYLERAMQALVAALVDTPFLPVRRVSVLPVLEREQLLRDFSGAQTGQRRDALIHTLFEAQAQAQPHAVAVVCEAQWLSFAELNRRANQLAHYLRSLGVRPDDRVAICIERSIEMVVGVLGVLKAGGAYVPLDPAAPMERLAYMLSDSAPVALLTVTAAPDNLPASSLLRIVVLDDATVLAKQPEDNLDAAALELDPSHLAYVIYTSGSTGQPKGVMVPHRGVVNYLTHAHTSYLYEGIDGGLVATPLSFDATVTTLLAPWLAGKPVVLLAEDSQQCLAQLLSYCDRPQPWLFKLTPAHLDMLSNLRDAPPVGTPHRWVVGGEQLTTRSLQRLRARLLPNAIVINEYGPTETVVGCTTFVSDGRHDAALHESVPIGQPIANSRIYILGSAGEPVPVGVAGEIYIGGAGVARGYLHRPELTAERFLQDPFCSDAGARMYKSGDVGRWLPDGTIEYLGRNDLQVKIRGFRIELEEIEAKLARCTGVREAIVIAREDAPGEKRLVAYVVSEEAALSAAGLRAQLLAQLPEYMVPSAFVSLAALPLTPNGKLDRRGLPAPDQVAVASREYAAPLGALEQTIAALWQELLGLERVGRHDHFFELGGHSLLALRLVTRLCAVLGVEVALRDVFAQPTLAELAQTVSRAAASTQGAIVPVERSQALPLSWAQQRLWFLDQLDHAAGAAYHLPAALRLSGELNRAALRASLDRIVARHENLRTSFISVEGAPQQVIAPAETGFTLIEHDLQAIAPSMQQATVAELTLSEARAPFDLSSGPLIRGRLLCLSETEHVLLVTQHHIISDGWSIGVLVREVSALYRAYAQGQPDPLPPLALQYADYAVWQRQWLQGAVLRKQLEFWRQQLSGAPALLALPTDRPRPAAMSYRGANVSVRVSRELSAGLRALAQRHGVTLFMTLLAGWSALLSRLSGQDDIVIGSPVANRQRAEIEPLIGFFVNTLALRVDLTGDPSVAVLLARIRSMTLEAYAHQELPFEQVVEALQPERSLSHNAVFQATLSLNNTPSDDGLNRLPSLTLTAIEGTQQTTRFDLSLTMIDTLEGLVGAVIYATDLFDRSTVERILGHWVRLLGAMVADEAQSVSRLPLLSLAEREQVLKEFNATRASCPQALLHEVFAERAAQQPDADAVEYGGQRLSYGELNRRANQLAQRLLGLGVKPDDRVAICTERSLELVVGILGVLKAGGAYVPLDPSYPLDRLAYMLSDSAPVAVLTQAALRAGLPMLSAAGKPVLVLDEELDAPTEQAANPRVAGLSSQHLAYVIYTSGSTGQPKGVMVEHASLMNLHLELERSIFGALAARDRVGLNAGFSFDSSIKSLLQLLSGRCVVIIPQLVRADGSALLDFVSRNRLDAFDCTPIQAELLLTAGLLESTTHRPKAVLIGGEAIAPNTWRRLSRVTTPSFFNVYGPTECTVDSSIAAINGAGDRPQIGRPIANAQIYILDAHGQPVPLGTFGELYIGGAGVARGYLHRPELTAERFLRDPFSSDAGARMYKSGDVGRWLPDGTIEYLGRNDLQVKIRGFRIEPGEIEARLVGCAGVGEAAVIAYEDASGEKRLVAYVVPRQLDAELSVAVLREQLLQELPEYMVPSAFVSLAQLPLTPNGKLDRKALPAPDQAAVASRAYEAPVGEVEQAIAEIWQELLELERVGRRDHFFELGGHSLLAVKVVVRIKDVLQVDVDLRDVFTSPQLSALAEMVLEQQLAQFDQSELLTVLDSMKEESTAD